MPGSKPSAVAPRCISWRPPQQPPPTATPLAKSTPTNDRWCCMPSKYACPRWHEPGGSAATPITPQLPGSESAAKLWCIRHTWAAAIALRREGVVAPSVCMRGWPSSIRRAAGFTRGLRPRTALILVPTWQKDISEPTLPRARVRLWRGACSYDCASGQRVPSQGCHFSRIESDPIGPPFSCDNMRTS